MDVAIPSVVTEECEDEIVVFVAEAGPGKKVTEAGEPFVTDSSGDVPPSLSLSSVADIFTAPVKRLLRLAEARPDAPVVVAKVVRLLLNEAMPEEMVKVRSTLDKEILLPSSSFN